MKESSAHNRSQLKKWMRPSSDPTFAKSLEKATPVDFSECRPSLTFSIFNFQCSKFFPHRTFESAEKDELEEYEILRIAERGTISVQKMSEGKQEEIFGELQLFRSRKAQWLKRSGCQAAFRGICEVSCIHMNPQSIC